MNRNVTLFLHGLVGIGAIAGGMGVVIDPSGSLMGAPLELLKSSPFKDYLIPGLFLVIVLGLGNISALVIALKKPQLSPYASMVIGGVLVLWIIIQCIMIQSVAAPHVLFFIIGCVQGILGLIDAFQKKVYPLNRILK